MGRLGWGGGDLAGSRMIDTSQRDLFGNDKGCLLRVSLSMIHSLLHPDQGARLCLVSLVAGLLVATFLLSCNDRSGRCCQALLPACLLAFVFSCF